MFVPEAYRMGGRIRAEWPAEALRQIGWDVAVVPYGRWIPMEPRWRTKVVVIHRADDPVKVEAVRWGRHIGAKVVLSEDDNIFALPPGRHVSDASREASVTAARMADRIIVTTDALADLYRRWSDDTRVIPNYLPAWVKEIRASKLDPPTVGWRGSVMGHRSDLEWFRPYFGDLGAPVRVIGQWTKATPTQIVAGFERWDPPDIEFTETGWISSYPRVIREMSRCAVGIVPLAPTRFNQAKSWLAAMEWLAAGVPVIATATPDNRKLETEYLPPMVVRETPEQIVSDVRFILENSPTGIGEAWCLPTTLESQVQQWAIALTF